MKALALLPVLLALSGCSNAGPLQEARVSYVAIHGEGKGITCGSTKVGHRTVLTAEHCVHPDMKVQGQVPELVLVDGADHALVILPQPIKGGSIAAMAHRLPEIGDKLYVWGMPLGKGPLWREGIVSGQFQTTGAVWTIADIMVTGGDSGSGIYNEQGRLVATVSIQLNPGNPFGVWGPVGWAPYKFTVEQWQAIR